MQFREPLDYGITDLVHEEAGRYPQLFTGRVIFQAQGMYRVWCAGAELTAHVTGKLRHAAFGMADFPAVGDWVMLDRDTDAGGSAVICHILPRKSAFIRKAAGKTTDEQVVAANIDKVLICMALNSDFNPRRLERYLSVAWDSGALPVVVLTKSDLCANVDSMRAEAESVAAGVDVICISSLQEDGYLDILPYIRKGETVALIGSSGVGKSTLLNRLLGYDALDTAEVDEHGKGRHTTTSRQLVVLASGAIVMDTPGMRELGLDSADIENAFSDIEKLAHNCRFRDCTHASEPGCAVQRAIESGALAVERLASYNKLKREVAYEGKKSRQIEQAKLKEMFSGMGGVKNARDYIKNKNNWQQENE